MVAGDLCDDRGRGDRRTMLITFDLGDDVGGRRHIRRVECAEGGGDVIVWTIENPADTEFS